MVPGNKVTMRSKYEAGMRYTEKINLSNWNMPKRDEQYDGRKYGFRESDVERINLLPEFHIQQYRNHIRRKFLVLQNRSIRQVLHLLKRNIPKISTGCIHYTGT
ncbi:Glutamyl-tRNA(Gln) amidotransferase subunit [Dirofilaria immitis]